MLHSNNTNLNCIVSSINVLNTSFDFDKMLCVHDGVCMNVCVGVCL